MKHYPRAQSQGCDAISHLEERGVERENVWRFSSEGRERAIQSDQHWKCVKGNTKETSERRSGAHMGGMWRIFFFRAQRYCLKLISTELKRNELINRNGGGFFLACEDFGRMFNNSFPACAFFKWRLACARQFHALVQDQSTVAQRAETTVTKCSLTSCA